MNTDQMKADAVMALLKTTAPEVYALLSNPNFGVEKNLTVGDAHQTTALGNQDPKKKKAKNFAQALADGDGKPKVHEDAGNAAKSLAFDVDGETDGDDRAEIEWELPMKILKFEPSQRLIFGWASIATKDGQLIVDKQNDMILPEDLEKAAYEFVLTCRAQGDMHKQTMPGQPQQVGRMVESMMFTKEKQDVLKIDLGVEGWWVGFYVDDDNVWDAHKKGERPEFSIGGRGKRVSV